MSKRAGEFYGQEYSSVSSKKTKLNKDANWGLIPVLKLGDDWYVYRKSCRK